MTREPASYPRRRFPADIISHAVWLYRVFSYHAFSLTLRVLHDLWRAVDQHALCWTFWCRTDETAQLPSVSSSIYCMGCSTSHDASSRTVCVAMAWRSGRSCPMFGIGRAGT